MYQNVLLQGYVIKKDIEKELLKSIHSDKNKELIHKEVIEKIQKEYDASSMNQIEYFRLIKDEYTRYKAIATEVTITEKDIDTTTALNDLFEYHLENRDKASKTKALLVIFKCIELEDENKKLTLTDKQYKMWLKNGNLNQYINTKQFEVLYSLTARQQKGLRAKTTDQLPYYQITDGSCILYKRVEVEKWLENYKGRMLF